jgi:hypothetical protein
MTNTLSASRRRAARRALSALAWSATALFLGLPPQAGATAPVERVTCTTEPRSRWLAEGEMKRLFGVEKYALVKFKVSRANCYEFYAVGREGGVVEAYYHPVTGLLVKETRVGGPASPKP